MKLSKQNIILVALAGNGKVSAPTDVDLSSKVVSAGAATPVVRQELPPVQLAESFGKLLQQQQQQQLLFILTACRLIRMLYVLIIVDDKRIETDNGGELVQSGNSPPPPPLTGKTKEAIGKSTDTGVDVSSANDSEVKT